MPISKDDITVYIPSRNRHEKLAQRIKEIREEFKGLIVIGDDLSDQNELLEKRALACYGENVRLLEFPSKMSLTRNWNMGLALCPTRYWMYFSDKARLRKGWVDALVERLNLGGEYILFENHYAFCLDRAIIPKMGWFDERFPAGGHEDMDYMIRAIAQGIKFGAIGGFLELDFSGYDDPATRMAIAYKEGGSKTIWNQETNWTFFLEKWEPTIPEFNIHTAFVHPSQLKRKLDEIDWHPFYTKKIKEEYV